MDQATASAVLSIAGGAAELGGLGLLVLGIQRDRSQARTLLQPTQPPGPPDRSYPGKISAGGGVGGGDPFRDMQSLSAQQRDFASQVEKGFAMVANGMIDMRRAIDTERDQLGIEIRDEVNGSHNDLREKLKYLLAGSIKDRYLGVGLLAAGIILSVVGSVLGAG